ncbi:SRPBCC family protein [Streptosporangiaceae bacterium NEAU-GS5]|nr:SRPBCC family protein [Streptosporangiaceae bacterium NEAU-GS5]
MRSVMLRAKVPGPDPGMCFDRISDFARYPELVDVVRSVAVHPPAADGLEHSDWEVYFRNGILRWSEADRKDGSTHRITFEQTDGDFDSFHGSWSVAPAGGACAVTFETEFDFGIPSLAGILDPIAERVFKETIARVLTGLFGSAEVVPEMTGAS